MRTASTTIPPSTKTPTQEWSSWRPPTVEDSVGHGVASESIAARSSMIAMNRAQRAPDDVTEQRAPLRAPLRLRYRAELGARRGDRRLLDLRLLGSHGARVGAQADGTFTAGLQSSYVGPTSA
jgi:hypothetical protein